jgi:protease IV
MASNIFYFWRTELTYMRSFFKYFFASLLAIIVFCMIIFFLMLAVVGTIASKDKEEVASKTILQLDLGQTFSESSQQDPLGVISGEGETPTLYELVRLIKHAKTDDNISGIFIKANGNGNGFASSNELRNALLDFRNSKKFVIAHADVMTQQSYFVASAAQEVYLNPVGGLSWEGFNITMPFIKGTLEKMDIETQIFYAGKYKSATEIFRTDKMTPENKLQTEAWLGDIYRYFLSQTAAVRKLDTAFLHGLAVNQAIQTPEDAVKNRLVDALKYDDQVKDEFKRLLKLDKYDKINLTSFSDYNDAVNIRKGGSERIALIYAEGDIVDGMGDNENIGGENFQKMIRRARLDKSVKAIVLRVNSGGGSALASDQIWRELQMAKKDGKPVVVSFGDVAASGGYYIACGADSIFANPNTITGSIGVFGVIPNMQGFFKNKLGVTFDGVKTAPHADAGGVHRPLTEPEKKIIQGEIERIYLQFKQRVADGRKKDINYIDSIAQGRVWSGEDALQNGLVDKMGNLQDAIACAARMTKLSSYGLKEYPESESWINTILNKRKSDPAAMIRTELGEENFKIYRQMIRVREMTRSVQARLPFEFFIQ